MKDVIKNILDYAVDAPSGNNSQPWKFAIRENKIYIYNISDSDITPYNFDQMGAFVAHGALIENILIAASRYGYLPKIEPFPDAGRPDIVAVVVLEKTLAKDEPLFDYIPKRGTNRRSYRKIPLTTAQRNEILETEKEIIGGGKIELIEERGKMAKLAFALGLHERLIFENKMIHDIVFSKVLWTAKEHSEKRKWLYIKTKFSDMPCFLLPLMKPFGNWSFVRIINKIGFSKKIHQQSAAACVYSSALGAVLVDGDNKENFLLAGRLFQRIWLKAVKFGLSIQPVTGIPYLARRILIKGTDGFSTGQAELIMDANEIINNIFEARGTVVAMVFRIGYADKPPVKTLKLPPSIMIDD